MKKLILSLAVLGSINAFARTAMVDGIPYEFVVQSIEMAGRPGYQTRAALVRNQESGDLDLVIIESRGIHNYLVVSNDKLGLSELAKAKLSVNEAGSVLISANNENFPSRDMWNRTLTVSFRNGDYLLSGFTLDYRDTRLNKAFTCDLNLLAGRGIRNGFQVPLKSQATPIRDLEDSEMLYTCYGW